MLLSICIPTYNRSEFLKKTLESLVTQKGWPFPDVEIVISDNVSTDDTALVIAEYISRYPENIRGKTLTSGIDAHDNFDLVMSQAEGEFIKLNNDTLMWEPGMLGEFISVLRNSPADIFLTPSTPMAPVSGKMSLSIKSMDEVVSNCSYFLTWIGNLCVRKNVFLNLEDRNRRIASRLTQVDIILRLISAGASVVVDGRIFFRTQNVVKNLDYQIAEIFCCNYFELLGEYLGKGISQNIFELEKKRMLFDFLIPAHFDFFHERAGEKQKKFWKNTGIYHKNLYFYIAFIKVFFLWLASRIFTHDQLRLIKHKIFKRNNI